VYEIPQLTTLIHHKSGIIFFKQNHILQCFARKFKKLSLFVTRQVHTVEFENIPKFRLKQIHTTSTSSTPYGVLTVVFYNSIIFNWDGHFELSISAKPLSILDIYSIKLPNYFCRISCADKKNHNYSLMQNW
jgi:hypothetical protein